MKASELIALLQKLVTEHGDRFVFSEADWGFVRDCEADDDEREMTVESAFSTGGVAVTEMVKTFTLTE